MDIIQICDKVLKYEELLTDLGERCEKAFYNIWSTDDIDELLRHSSESLNELNNSLNNLEDVLKSFEWANNIVYDLIDASNLIEDLQGFDTEDIITDPDMEGDLFFRVKFIMDKIRLLRDILKWVIDGNKD